MGRGLASGVVNLNKPAGPTSHDVIAAVRRGTGVKRVGHAGTLDPLASGVLLVLVGQATRLSEYLMAHDKRYRATVRFGATTDTLDAGGPPIPGRPVTFDRAALESALTRFEGNRLQTPPAYSAIKVGGRKAYDLARAGQAVALPPRPVTIHSLALVAWEAPDLVLDVHCTAGTYIRALARDLGEALGTGAYLLRLTRTASGSFRLEDSADLADFKLAMAEGRWESHLLSPAQALSDVPAVLLDETQTRRLTRGQTIPRTAGSPPGLARGLNAFGQLVAVLRPNETGELWRPEKVLLTQD